MTVDTLIRKAMGDGGHFQVHRRDDTIAITVAPRITWWRKPPGCPKFVIITRSVAARVLKNWG